MSKITLLTVLLIITVLSTVTYAQYTWLDNYDSTQRIVNRISAPDGFTRVEVEKGSFAHWLRNLPLKKGNPPIYFYDGDKKFNQLANHSVIDIDIGDKDLQQCADAVIRLRSEYFYSKNQYDSIAFDFTSGDRFIYSEWLNGITPKIFTGNVIWNQFSKRENSREVFNDYLNIVFMYSGSYSLSRELKKVNINDIQIGDVFIKGGFPGHAMLVADVATNIETGNKIILLTQSYMPAQSVHIVKNPISWGLSPWFKANFENKLYTLEWHFEKNQLMRFR